MDGDLTVEEFVFARLRPNIVIAESSSEVHLIGDSTVFFRDPPAGLVSALHLLKGGIDARILAKRLGSVEVTDWLLDHLEGRGALQRSPVPFRPVSRDPTTAYFESVAREPHALRSLRDMHVWIVGCGGVGGLVAQHLIAAGVGRLTLVDFDVVGATNLNRQYLFTDADVGRRKLEAAKERLLALRPDVEIDLIEHRLSPESELVVPPDAHADACVCAADTPPESIRDLVSRLATKLGATFAAAGVGLFAGSWGPILTPDDPVQYHDWADPAALPRDGSIQLSPLQASFGPTNSLIAACLARDLIHVLIGDDAPSRRCRVTFDFRSLGVNRHGVS